MIQQYTIEFFELITRWSNDNQGMLTLVLFCTTLLLGWLSGIFSGLRRRPKFCIDLNQGPSFVCTFGTGAKQDEYDIHRTGIALYLRVANVGSAAASIESVAVGYHWAIVPFKLLWLRYGIGWFWLKYQVTALEDFQANIGEHLKVYPFLFQKNSTHIGPAETFLEVGRTTNGVVYFEQPDSWGACFPVSRNKAVRIKIKIMDSFGRSHTRNFWVPRFTLQEARSYNPSFGLTLTAMRGQAEPIELPADHHGNVVPSSLRRSA